MINCAFEHEVPQRNPMETRGAPVDLRLRMSKDAVSFAQRAEISASADSRALPLKDQAQAIVKLRPACKAEAKIAIKSAFNRHIRALSQERRKLQMGIPVMVVLHIPAESKPPEFAEKKRAICV